MKNDVRYTVKVEIPKGFYFELLNYNKRFRRFIKSRISDEIKKEASRIDREVTGGPRKNRR